MLIFFIGILICLTWNLLCFVPNSIEILTWIFSIKLFCENFLQTKAIIYQKNVTFRPTFLQFYSRYVLRWNIPKKITQVLSYVICTHVRRHIHEEITKMRYREGKQGHFVFEKQVLFTSDLRLTTPYSLCLFVWKFYQILFIVYIEFWLRFQPQIHLTRFTIKY